MGGAIKIKAALKPLDRGQVDDIILPWVADEVPACLNMPIRLEIKYSPSNL